MWQMRKGQCRHWQGTGYIVTIDVVLLLLAEEITHGVGIQSLEQINRRLKKVDDLLLRNIVCVARRV